MNIAPSNLAKAGTANMIANEDIARVVVLNLDKNLLIFIFCSCVIMSDDIGYKGKEYAYFNLLIYKSLT
ncbi:hypothetical protein VA208B3_19910 [Vibrio alginolyticus]|nr:hypothetical protein VA208B3_19910 [Vibrio alginolyticus]